MCRVIFSILFGVVCSLGAQEGLNWMQQYELLRDNQVCQLSSDKDIKEEQATALLLACCLHDDAESFKKLESAYFNSVRTQLLGLGSVTEFLSHTLLSQKTSFGSFLHDAQEVSYTTSAYKIQEYLKKQSAHYFARQKKGLVAQRWLDLHERPDWNSMYKGLLEEPGTYAFSVCPQTCIKELCNLATIAVLSGSAEDLSSIFESYLKWRYGSVTKGRIAEAVCARLGVKTVFNRVVLSVDALSHSVNAEQVQTLLKTSYAADALKMSPQESLAHGSVVLKSRL